MFYVHCTFVKGSNEVVVFPQKYEENKNTKIAKQFFHTSKVCIFW